MPTEVIVAVVSGFFILSTAIVNVLFTRKVKDSIKEKTNELEEQIKTTTDFIGKKIDETAKFKFIQGSKSAFDELTRITLDEPLRLRVTRFNPRKIEKRERYFSSIMSRLCGIGFEGEKYPAIERYNRLTSLNSEENKESLLHQIDLCLANSCTNLFLRVTSNTHDFELVIAENDKTAVFCFHDLGNQVELNSCFVTTDQELYNNFSQLYEKLWNSNVLLEIDFSRGKEHVLEMREKLMAIQPIIN